MEVEKRNKTQTNRIRCWNLEVGNAGMPGRKTLNARERKVLKAAMKKVPSRRHRDQVVVDVAKSQQRCPVQLQRAPCLVANSLSVAYCLSKHHKYFLRSSQLCTRYAVHSFACSGQCVKCTRQNVLEEPATIPERRRGVGIAGHLQGWFQCSQDQVLYQTSPFVPRPVRQCLFHERLQCCVERCPAEAFPEGGCRSMSKLVIGSAAGQQTSLADRRTEIFLKRVVWANGLQTGCVKFKSSQHETKRAKCKFLVLHAAGNFDGKLCLWFDSLGLLLGFSCESSAFFGVFAPEF